MWHCKNCGNSYRPTIFDYADFDENICHYCGSEDTVETPTMRSNLCECGKTWPEKSFALTIDGNGEPLRGKVQYRKTWVCSCSRIKMDTFVAYEPKAKAEIIEEYGSTEEYERHWMAEERREKEDRKLLA
jgi:hypothetical protein